MKYRVGDKVLYSKRDGKYRFSLLIEDVLSNGYIVIKFDNPDGDSPVCVNGNSLLYFEDHSELDIQWYRENRLNKLLC